MPLSLLVTSHFLFYVMQWSVLLPVVLTLLATYDNEEGSKYIEFISDLCYTKWALEAFVISNAKRFGF